jgi:DeoR/GlpR family transcriptional regulator of sugar metabolism
MLTEQRRQILLDRLKRDGRLVARDLSEELGLSEDTLRRDLRELAAAGLLTRFHGGALPASPTVASLGRRRGMAVEEKQRLARSAAPLVERGQTVFIDGGTTHLELVRCLPLDLRATVITHSPLIAAALEPHENVELILIGGTILRHSMVAIGAAAHDAILKLRVDVFFLGLTALHPVEGATTGHYEEAAIKRAIAARAAEVVTLATAEKLGAVSPHLIAPAAAITSLVIAGEADVSGWGAMPYRVIRA